MERGRSLVLCGLLTCVSLLVSSGRASAEPTETSWYHNLRWFVNDRAGFKVRLPVPWFVEEANPPGMFRATVGAEEVDKSAAEHFHCVVTVTRLKDYRTLYRFASVIPSDMALEYVHDLPALHGEEGARVIETVEGPISRMDSWLFKVARAQDRDDTPSVWVFVGVRGVEWVDAVWFIPCREHGARQEDVREILKSFTIFKKWDDADN